jgi:hypothetical protein
VIDNLTLDEIHAIAADAARAAVVEVFVTLGVDAKDPIAVLTMQKDFAHLRVWRESVETIRKQSLKTAVGVIITGLLGMITLLLAKGHLP